MLNQESSDLNGNTTWFANNKNVANQTTKDTGVPWRSVLINIHPRDLWEAFRSCEGLRSCLEEDGRFSGFEKAGEVPSKVWEFSIPT